MTDKAAPSESMLDDHYKIRVTLPLASSGGPIDVWIPHQMVTNIIDDLMEKHPGHTVAEVVGRLRTEAQYATTALQALVGKMRVE